MCSNPVSEKCKARLRQQSQEIKLARLEFRDCEIDVASLAEVGLRQCNIKTLKVLT